MRTKGERPRVRAWTLGTGILLVVIGFCFLLLPLLGTLVAGIVAGALLLAGGIAQLADAVTERGGGWGWSVALGVFTAVAGLFLLFDPVAAMIGVTALLAGYLIVSGSIRMVLAAAWSPVPGWGWMLFNGVVALLLGLFVLSGWPRTGFWTIGVFLGVDALLSGFSRVARSLAAQEPADRMIPTARP